MAKNTEKTKETTVKSAEDFAAKLKAAAEAARAYTEDLDGTDYVAVTPDGTRVAIPLTMDIDESEAYEELLGGASKTSEVLAFLEDFAGTETTDVIRKLPVELSGAIMTGWAKALMTWQGVTAGE